MPDAEKVIKGLEWCMNEKHDCYREKGCPYENEGEDIGCKYALHRDALALLKAQEPIAPIQGMDDQDEDIFCCGSCGAVVGETFLGPPGECEVRDNYCPECGRAVKWDG